MDQVMNKFRRGFGQHAFVKDERGLSTVEYVIIFVLIAAVAIGLWMNFGTILKKKITASNDELDKVDIKSDDK